MRKLKEMLFAGMLLLEAQGTSQALTTYQFIGYVFDGPYADTYGFGSFTVDETLGDGLQNPDVPGFALEFTIFGQTFTHEDDVDFDEYPQIEIFGGVPFMMDFLVEDGSPVDILEPGVLSIAIPDVDLLEVPVGDDVPDFFRDYDFITAVTIQVEEVPVPEAGTSLALLGLGAAALAMTRRALRK